MTFLLVDGDPKLVPISTPPSTQIERAIELLTVVGASNKTIKRIVNGPTRENPIGIELY